MRQRMELWGGAECTVNRVGDAFGDQLRATGHHDRIEDLDLLAPLGFSAIRYPVLWERVAPDDPNVRDWRWSDARLGRLRALGIRPIVGLVHHGSGPRYTGLLEDSFAPGLAAHARAVAERYPWVEEWTPVNEPLTTARFSALYGHWYPHARDEQSFWLALLNQTDATRLAMAEIRKVNPAARLIQTDDLGRTYATAPMRDQAAFNNTRRWMGWDLLCGRVTPGHDFWGRLCDFGFENRLRAIADAPCPPDVIGINHYLTSDRFLDHRIRRYPDLPINRQPSRYIDVEAARVLDPPLDGIDSAIRDAWARYGIPIALTEVHNGCTRDEQLRWLADAWAGAERARANGIDLVALTCWALFGSKGWNTLLTAEGKYEPGIFDTSGGAPRPTALASLIGEIGASRAPALAGPRWWLRDIRLRYPAVPRPAPMREHQRAATKPADWTRPLLITGATGTLGQALARACRHRGIAYVLTSRAELDLADEASIARALETARPWAVINAAGWVRVDDAEDDPQGCIAANADGAIALARACAERGIPSVSFSSDLVFGPGANRPLVESDAPAPLSVYGRSKAIAEEGIAALEGAHLIVRTAAFFSPFDPHNFAAHAIAAFERGESFAAREDATVSPSYVPHLCDAVLDLLIDGERGIWHLTNGEAVSWADFARRIAGACGYDPDRVRGVRGLATKAPQPAFSALSSERGRLMPSLDEALAHFAAHRAKPATLARRAPLKRVRA